MRITWIGLATLVLGLLPRGASEAQTVELRLRADSSRVPIAGAIARLIRGDSVIAQALTNELGLTTLPARAPGTYRIRIDRIGFTGFLTNSFGLEAAQTFRIEVTVPSTAVSLPEVVVRAGKSQCDTRPAEGALAAQLWEEIRKALTANVLTQEERATPVLVREFERELTPSGKRLREWVFRSAVVRGQPFASVSPRQLARMGFVYADADTAVFSLPDARLLLSDEFVSTHCFRAVPGPLNRIGLAFEPTPNRSMPEVSGTLWVNRLTSELQELEFAYTGLARELAHSELGGRVEFRRLPSGSWIVSYWQVRMPVLGSFERYRARQATEEITRVVGMIEQGGRAELASTTTDARARAILIGRVMDSTVGSGLSGTMITVAGGDDSVVSANSGEFELAVPVWGPTLVTATHAKLTATRAVVRREAVLSLGDTTRIEFAVPSIPALVRSRCGTPGKRAGVIGLVSGREGTPEPNGELLASWRTPTGSVRTERTRSDERGVYAFCDLPPDQPVTLHLRQGRVLLGERTVKLGWAEFRWLDLRVTPP